MAKLSKSRLVLRDSLYRYHQICSLGLWNEKDSDDPIAKIIFPNFPGASLFPNIGFREVDGFLDFSSSEPAQRCNIIEASYHYFLGITHLVTPNRQHLAQRRDFPDLRKANKPVLLCRLLLKNWEVTTKRASTDPKNDLVVDAIGLPCVIGFYFSYSEEEKGHKFLTRTDGTDAHFTSIPGNRLGITMTQYLIPKIDSNYLFFESDPYSWEKQSPNYIPSME